MAEDIAVGAPFEDESRGAVCTFTSTAKSLPNSRKESPPETLSISTGTEIGGNF
jgi:hypothetical protein